ncbi:N-formylglutamate deformylase [Ramlibacter sp. PS4R-6]|uniref:N-formylglutamate deformylase n=1 Tax=Ramlibacter sp. PS4R-6 TaxID=3133438 RepID=UPI0030AF3897
MSFSLHRGSAPLLVSMPHVGTEIPAELRDRYVERALQVEDTDWHLARLYAWARDIGASVLQPRYSRYVIDLNRPPDDAPMYPGASNTELCPTRFFTGDPLYREGREPDTAERAHRRATYWQPYHDALAGELERIKAQHGFALLWDGHSIRSRIPWLFEGELPGLNIGTANDVSADETITRAVANAARRHPEFTHVANGRFKGGYITRHYGRPAQDVHAVQLEMCQKLYMQEEAPFAYDEEKAATVIPVVREMLLAALVTAEAIHAR